MMESGSIAGCITEPISVRARESLTPDARGAVGRDEASRCEEEEDKEEESKSAFLTARRKPAATEGGVMPTVEEYKIGILRQLAELTAQGREPVLPLRSIPVDEAIRAVAELEIQGIVVFEDDSRACLLTEYGETIVNRLIAELETKQRK